MSDSGADNKHLGFVFVHESLASASRQSLIEEVENDPHSDLVVVEVGFRDDAQPRSAATYRHSIELPLGRLAGTNYGINSLLGADCDLDALVVVQDDVALTFDALRRLGTMAAEGSETDVFAPAIGAVEGTIDARSGGHLSRTGGLRPYTIKADRGLIEVDWIDGGVLSFRPTAWEQGGEFQAAYLDSMGVVDFCRAIKDIGGRCYLSTDVVGSTNRLAPASSFSALRSGFYFRQAWYGAPIAWGWAAGRLLKEGALRPSGFRNSVAGLRAGAQWHRNSRIAAGVR